MDTKIGSKRNKFLGRNKIHGRNFAVAGIVFIGLILFCAVLSSRKSYTYRKEVIKISTLLSVSIHLAERAGEKIVEIRKDKNIKTSVKGHTDEGAAEYVTQGDQQSHSIIKTGLSDKWPHLNIISEEKGSSTVPSQQSSSRMLSDHNIYNNNGISRVKGRDEEVIIDDITVWVDPLDATQEYTEGTDTLLEYVMVMVCIVVDGYPVGGVLHQPFAKDSSGRNGVTYWGWVNHGVSDTLTQVDHTPKDHDQLRVVSSRSHSANIEDIVQSLHHDNVKHTTMGGAGYKTIQVATNRADVYIHGSKIKKWDTCAGNAVINAIDGTMTTLNGDTIDYSYHSKPVIEDGLLTTTDRRTHSDLSKYITKQPL